MSDPPPTVRSLAVLLVRDDRVARNLRLTSSSRRALLDLIQVRIVAPDPALDLVHLPGIHLSRATRVSIHRQGLFVLPMAAVSHEHVIHRLRRDRADAAGA